jgi:hypothetical protein
LKHIFRHGFIPPDKLAYLSGIKSGYSQMLLLKFCLPPYCLARENGQAGYSILREILICVACHRTVLPSRTDSPVTLDFHIPAAPPDCLVLTDGQAGLHAPHPSPPPCAPLASSPPLSPPCHRLQSRPVPYEAAPCPTKPLRALRSRRHDWPSFTSHHPTGHGSHRPSCFFFVMSRWTYIRT